MVDIFLKVSKVLFDFLKVPVLICLGIFALFFLVCGFWYLIFRFKHGMVLQVSSAKRLVKRNFLLQLLVDVPRRYMLDLFQRPADFFEPCGIRIFCGEQGSGKTIACTHQIMQLQRRYPACKVLTNYGYQHENCDLDDWHKLLDYGNGHKGVVVGIDEIQNWFMSGSNKMPEGMLEVVTQNRKNRRIICCTAQVFTRVNKAIREQVSLVYEPHTFFGCFSIVVIYKPLFDSEGNVIRRKYRGIYSFVHTDELRGAYDTYKVIHRLSKEGFKEPAIAVLAK